MAPEPIDHQNPSPQPPLWTDPKHLPGAVQGLFKAAFYLSSPMEDYDSLAPTVFGDIVFQLRNYHSEMAGLNVDASSDCQELAESLTTSLNVYHVVDVDGGAAVSAASGVPDPVPEVSVPPPNVSVPMPDVQDPVVVAPSQ